MTALPTLPEGHPCSAEPHEAHADERGACPGVTERADRHIEGNPESGYLVQHPWEVRPYWFATHPEARAFVEEREPELTLALVRQSVRPWEVFTRVKVDEPWMRCQHGKQIIEVQAHWADDAPFVVTTIAGQPQLNSTQRYSRWVHADGSPSESFEYNTVTRCGGCGALDTLTVEQQAYGDLTRCAACPWTHWYDIGD
jgi:hypothetical protein